MLRRFGEQLQRVSTETIRTEYRKVNFLVAERDRQERDLRLRYLHPPSPFSPPFVRRCLHRTSPPLPEM
jgi:hypothetical protein